MSCIDASVRIVTQSPRDLYLYSPSLWVVHKKNFHCANPYIYISFCTLLWFCCILHMGHFLRLASVHQIGLKIYRGPGFLAIVWFNSTPTPSPPFSRQQVVSLCLSSCVSPVESLLMGKGEGRIEPNHTMQEAWPSINRSTLSGVHRCLYFLLRLRCRILGHLDWRRSLFKEKVSWDSWVFLFCFCCSATFREDYLNFTAALNFFLLFSDTIIN